MNDWFTELLGFKEGNDARKLREKLQIDGQAMTSTATGETFTIGTFDTPSLRTLRENAMTQLRQSPGRAVAAGLRGDGAAMTVSNVFGDVAALHRQAENRLATFQVASQFNCLEFVGPNVTPEDGVTGYVHDRTQGPCCAIACGPATVYRNYFAPVRDASGKVKSEGQSRGCQIENLRDIANCFDEGSFPRVVGGYTLASDDQLRSLNARLQDLSEADIDELRCKLRIGVQRDTQVTSADWGRVQIRDRGHVVTQVFGSACSVSYSRNSELLWRRLASLVLEASFEATLWVTVLNALHHAGDAGSRRVYLTAIGGGVFGNSMDWIEAAIRRAVNTVLEAGAALDVRVVTYVQPAPRGLEALAAEGPWPVGAGCEVEPEGSSGPAAEERAGADGDGDASKDNA